MILFTGKGTSGSWQCRGVQLGGAVGQVKANATLEDCQKADAIVVVKRINAPFFANVLKSGKPWIWDLVDFYPQPLCGQWDQTTAIKWVRKQIKKANPAGIIWPNARMKKDCRGDGIVVYHHAREAPINPIRQQVKTVGYDGSAKFLGPWRAWLERECARRGWQFIERAPLHQVDIVVAFRHGEHNGYAQRRWKSNVKLANAHGTGTPFIGQPESAYLETGTGHEYWATDEKTLVRAFDALTPYEARLKIHQAFIANTFNLESRAEQVRRYVETLLRD